MVMCVTWDFMHFIYCMCLFDFVWDRIGDGDGLH